MRTRFNLSLDGIESYHQPAVEKAIRAMFRPVNGSALMSHVHALDNFSLCLPGGELRVGTVTGGLVDQSWLGEENRVWELFLVRVDTSLKIVFGASEYGLYIRLLDRDYCYCHPVDGKNWPCSYCISKRYSQAD